MRSGRMAMRLIVSSLSFVRVWYSERGENGNFTRLYWAIRGHKFAYPGRKDTIKACIYVKELVRFMLWKVEEGVNTNGQT